MLGLLIASSPFRGPFQIQTTRSATDGDAYVGGTQRKETSSSEFRTCPQPR
jgi:hypothetical protein